METDNTSDQTTSETIDDAYAQALELAKPSAEPTQPIFDAPAEDSEEGLTEQGKFVQAVATGEISQPEDTGVGTTSNLPPEVEQAERVEDSPLERFGLLEEETGATDESDEADSVGG